MKSNQGFKLLFLLLPFFFYSCQTKITAPELIINSVSGVEAYPYDGSIYVKFYGNNLEEGFIGYNVYVSRTSNIELQSISPVKNYNGSIPTIVYGYDTCYPDASNLTVKQIFFDSNNLPISNGYKYYITVTSYAETEKRTYESEHSNEVSVIPFKTYEFTLENHNNSGTTNDSIVLNNNIPELADAPDSLPSNWNGIFLFEIVEKNNKYIPCIVIKSNNLSIQDKGYYTDIFSLNNINNYGFISSPASLPAITSHLYLIYIPNYDKYIRIYVLDAPDVQNNLNANVSLKIKLGF